MLLDGLTKTYREGAFETPVLDAAALQLPRGETTSLVGVSGSGKSTLLHLIAGLLRPDAGTIVFDGQELGALDDAARARLRAKRIGVVLQSGNLIPFLTAGENVELAMQLANGHGRGNGRAVAAAGGAAPGPASCSASLAWPPAASTCHASSRGAKRSGCRWPWRWPTTQICSWPTR